MRVVVGHENLDLDALGSMALARYLHPGAVPVLVGGLEGRVREVVNLIADRLPLVPVGELPLDEVREVVVVDTEHPGRIGPLAALIGRVPFYVYDHHPGPRLFAAGGAVKPYGATVSVLAELLRERGQSPRPFEAELAYAGLLEDTGGFAYPGTTAADLAAGAWLLQHGADPARAAAWAEARLSPEARDVLKALLETARVVAAGPYKAVLARAEKEGYVPALAPLAHTLMDLFDADAVFLLLRLGDQRLVIARSRRGLDVDRLLASALGQGGGHPRAAFARVALPLEAIEDRIEAALKNGAAIPVPLRERMTRGVEAIEGELSVDEALLVLRSRGYGGMPVRAKGRYIGVLRRRDLERAHALGLGDRPAKGYLQPLVVLDADAPVEAAEAALKAGAGRVFVEEDGEIVGVFTRTDLYQKDAPEPGLPEGILEALPSGVQEVLRFLAERFPKATFYLVGGAVRDALLGAAGPDVDLVVVGEKPEAVARALVERFGGRYRVHPTFLTAEVELKGGLHVDLAAPREEHYPRPGALPRVRPAGIERDLKRRDFTVNAMALRVHPRPLLLLDPYGGREDLKARLLRPLSPVAFVEDPSRILRGLRLMARLGFRFTPEAERQLAEALSPEVLASASKSRFKDELWLALKEPSPLRALRAFERYGVLEKVFGLSPSPRAWAALERLEVRRPEEVVWPEAYLFLLLSDLSDPAAWTRRFGLPKTFAEGARRLSEPLEDPEAVRQLGPAFELAFLARYPERARWLKKPPRRLKGRDLLALGLTPGPAVGEILRAVAAARERGEVKGFEEELALARKLVKAYGTDRPST